MKSKMVDVLIAPERYSKNQLDNGEVYLAGTLFKYSLREDDKFYVTIGITTIITFEEINSGTIIEFAKEYGAWSVVTKNCNGETCKVHYNMLIQAKGLLEHIMKEYHC